MGAEGVKERGQTPLVESPFFIAIMRLLWYYIIRVEGYIFCLLIHEEGCDTMLTAVNGYIDGNKVIVNENIADWQGRNVIVTILDTLRNKNTTTMADVKDNAKRIAAAKELAGLWQTRDDISVDDMVRNMRRGRNFD